MSSSAVPQNEFCTNTLGWLAASPAALSKAISVYHWDLGIDNFLHPATDSDVNLSFDRFASWALVFLALYILFAILLKLIPGTGLQSGKLPFIASSRFIGITHCTIVVPLACMALTQQNSDWRRLEYLGPNTPLEQRVVELSVGYFVADFVHFILFEPDLLMFFHHVFSIMMMSSAGIAGRGSTCAMAALVQGEITNPLQSLFTIAKTAKSSRMLAVLSPVFTFVFVLVRVPLVPLWTGPYINHNLLFGPNRDALPHWIIYWWSAMSLLMALGGWLWSYSLIQGLRKFYSKKNAAGAGKTAKKMQ